MAGPADLAAWREAVESEWQAEATADAWARWHDKVVVQSAAATDAIVEVARLEPGLDVLDLASGTGDPALRLAQLVSPGGSVTLTDLSPRMLDVAREQARRAAVDNVEFVVADAHRLPFADDSFDVVVSRFGVMYFTEPQVAFRGCLRALRRGGRAAFVAWGPLEELPNLRLALEPFARRIELPSRHPDAPHPLRYSTPGRLQSELEQAGFTEVEEEWRKVPWPWPGLPEELWRRFYEGAVPFQPIVDGLEGPERDAAISEAIEAYREHYDGETVRMDVTIVVASATRR